MDDRYRVEVRITQDEKDAWHQKARKRNLTLSQFVREAIRAYTLSDGLAESEEVVLIDAEELGKIRYELNKIGTNINQIAKAQNASVMELDVLARKGLIDPVDLDVTLDRMESSKEGILELHETFKECVERVSALGEKYGLVTEPRRKRAGE